MIPGMKINLQNKPNDFFRCRIFSWFFENRHLELIDSTRKEKQPGKIPQLGATPLQFGRPHRPETPMCFATHGLRAWFMAREFSPSHQKRIKILLGVSEFHHLKQSHSEGPTCSGCTRWTSNNCQHVSHVRTFYDPICPVDLRIFIESMFAF